MTVTDADDNVVTEQREVEATPRPVRTMDAGVEGRP